MSNKPPQKSRRKPKPHKKRGPRLKLTDDVSGNLITMLQAGITVAIACEAVGISVTTYYAWMEAGESEKKDSIYRKFRKGAMAARALGEVNLVNILQKHAPNDPKTAQWMLERMHGERYGRRIENIVTAGGDKPITIALPPIIAAPPPIPRQMPSQTPSGSPSK